MSGLAVTVGWLRADSMVGSRLVCIGSVYSVSGSACHALGIRNVLNGLNE